MHARTDERHWGAVRVAIVSGAIVALLVAPLSALAGKGRGGGATTTSASLNLVVLDGAEAVSQGDRVTFTTNQTSTDRPFVGVRCYQGEDWVLDAYVGVFAGYMFDPWVTLSSDYWTAGAPASCTARLFYFDRRGNEKPLATTTFAVAP